MRLRDIMPGMKTSYIVIGLLVVAALALFIFTQPAAAPTMENTENTASDQKINIDEVCTSALAYMSFPDGASADAWVEACKRGEHPEAIEQWKMQMGISDDRAI